MSLSQMTNTLPTLIVFMVVGVIADRLDRRLIAIWADWIRAALTFILLVGSFLHSISIMFFTLFVRSAVGNFFLPAESGLMQGILSSEDYAVAVGIEQIQLSMFMLFGTSIGAVFYWAFGVQWAILLDALSYIISALLVATCRIPHEVRLPNGVSHIASLRFRPLMQDFLEGIIYVIRYRLLLNVTLGFFILGIVNGGFAVIPLFLIKYILAPHNYMAMYSLNGIISGAGILIGGLIAPSVSKRVKLYWMFILGLFVGGLLIFGEALASNIYIFLSIGFLFSLSLPFINVPFGGWLPQIIEPKKMGRVNSVISLISTTSTVATLSIIAWIFPRFVTVRDLFFLIGGCTLLTSLYFLLVLPPLIHKQHNPILGEKL